MLKNNVLIFTLLATLCSVPCRTENIPNKYTLNGYVKDTLTGEALSGAVIVVEELPNTGTSTNAYGFFSLTIAEGAYTITVHCIGYEPRSFQIALKQNVKQNFLLNERSIEQKEVVVTGERSDENVESIRMGVDNIDIKAVQSVPVLLGEKDILKTVQLLPGVKSASEGNSGFYVRGGGADQNLILLDEATVYGASHFLGFFSVFNSDAIKDVTVYKGAMPAAYGGRLSSVLDIKMKEGNEKQFVVNGGIGLIASRLMVEGPLIKNKMSFCISGRRTYYDLFLKSRFYFYDLNAKVNYHIGEEDRMYLSGYFGKDVFADSKIMGMNWGNATGTLRWNHLFSDKMFSNTSLIYSTYDLTNDAHSNDHPISIYSRIQGYNAKQDFQYYADAENGFAFGLNSMYYTIVPGTATSGTEKLELAEKYSWENALYISHEYKPQPFLRLEYGARFSAFSALGPGVFYTYNDDGGTINTFSCGSGKFVKTYFNIEPRIAVNYILDNVSSVKLAYARSTQNLHLLTNSLTDNPTNLWIPSSNNVQPEIADQVSLGYFRNFGDNTYEFSAETYYKNLQHQIDYKPGARLYLNDNVESQLLFGEGRAYGIELFFKKKYDRLNGWIGYTLSRAEMKFNGVNQGKYYPARQDRTHDVSIVGIYQLTNTWTLSATWVYSTGNAATFPSGKYSIAGQVINYYTERNGYRMPAYHRLDLGATWQGENSSWTFSLYNAYGRDNAYTIRFQEDPHDPTRTQAIQTSFFKFVPSITYNFKF